MIFSTIINKVKEVWFNYLDKILLFILKSRLKRYKRDAKWYHRQGCIPNWYDEQGIPNLEKEIKELAVKK